MDAARQDVHGDSLTRTTLRLGQGPVASTIAHVVHALQRVPGVLTVDLDTVNAQALVAHDSAVPLASLVDAVNSAGGSATVVTDCVDGAVPTAKVPLFFGRRQIKSAAVVAILALNIVNMTLGNSHEKRSMFIGAIVLLWAFVLIEGLVTQRRSE